MQLYPAIDIKDGKCVRLVQGKFEMVTVYEENPVKQAERFVESGATYLHIVDLDGARRGSTQNHGVIKQIAERFGVPVQTGGGIRSLADVERMLEAGVSRVILGTAAVKDPDLVANAVKKYGDQIAVGIDASDGKVAIQAWENVSDIDALALCETMQALGVKNIIYTDIANDGMMSGVNVKATQRLIEKTKLNVIASGGVSSYEDLMNVKKIGAAGAIIGKALYIGALDLSECLLRYSNSV